MSKRQLKSILTTAILTQSCTTFGQVFEDSKASLELRNFYFNRDFHGEDARQSKREEWAQGAVLSFQSGFTDGPIGVGVDALGMLGVKLDSSRAHSGTGLLPTDADGNAEEAYSKVTLTAKARLGKSELRVGGMNPVMPLLASNNTRLLPQVFRGTSLVSNDIDALTFSAYIIDAVKQRNSTDYEPLSATGHSTVEADHYNYLAVDYKLMPSLTASGHVAELEDIYRTNYFGLKLTQPLSTGTLLSEIRLFDAKETGKKRVGEVDNRTLSSYIAFNLNGHTFGGGYQKAWGDTPFAVVNGADTYLFAESLVSSFTAANERVWYARYDFNFVTLGIPGLTFSVKYVKGSDVDPSMIKTPQAARLRLDEQQGQEWERVMDLIYVVQSGPVKGLSFQWRNAVNRSNYADSADDMRLIMRYTLNF